jgi:polysaccharide export outer membrane protein
MRKAKLFLLPWMLIGSLLPSLAQTAPVPTDFTIGATDVLEINVLGVPDFTKELRVSGAGTIRLPFLGEVQVQGLTPSQAEAKLKGLLDPDYVKDAQVSVIMKEPRSRMFSLMGAVMRPGQFQMLQPVTLVSAIADAGGLDLVKAGDKATIQRSYGIRTSQVQSAVVPVAADDAKPAPAFQIEVDLKKLLMQGDMSLDVPIMPGDVISIPQREVSAVYVIGDVGRPGPFDFPADKGIKISRALAMAGGPTKTSKMKDGALLRQKPDGSMNRIALDFNKILKGKAPDMELQPNDLLYVPSSVGKNLGWATVTTLPTVLLNSLIYHY